MDEAIDDIHHYWFGELQPNGLCAPEKQPLWFKKSRDTDRDIRLRFGPLVERAVRGELDHWAETDRGLVALVLLLDQFSRNIYRDTPDAFAGDERALALALAAIDSDRHLALPAIHRVFLYLPLEHCENLSSQDRCVVLFDELARESGEDKIAEFARYATAHQLVIARFGRFPHRNPILGRDSSKEELDYLATDGGF